jgi:hypothetical protein
MSIGRKYRVSAQSELRLLRFVSGSQHPIPVLQGMHIERAFLMTNSKLSAIPVAARAQPGCDLSCRAVISCNRSG